MVGAGDGALFVGDTEAVAEVGGILPAWRI